MDIYDSANTLADEIRKSDLRREHARLQHEVMADETSRTLLKEYKRLQWSMQMQSMGGTQPSPEDTARFTKLSSLLFMNADVQAYLLAEMKLQKTLADVFKLLTDAAGISMDVLGQ